MNDEISIHYWCVYDFGSCNEFITNYYRCIQIVWTELEQSYITKLK